MFLFVQLIPYKVCWIPWCIGVSHTHLRHSLEGSAHRARGWLSPTVSCLDVQKEFETCFLSPRHGDTVSEMLEWCPNATMNINLIEKIGENKSKELDTRTATLLLIMEGFAGDWGAYESVKSTLVLEKMILNYQNKREESNVEWNWFWNYLKSQGSFILSFLLSIQEFLVSLSEGSFWPHLLFRRDCVSVNLQYLCNWLKCASYKQKSAQMWGFLKMKWAAWCYRFDHWQNLISSLLPYLLKQR